MIELIIIACLINEPTKCDEFRIPLPVVAERNQLPQCILSAMPQIAKWQGERPDWKPKKVTCELPEA